MTWLRCAYRRVVLRLPGHVWDPGGRCRACGTWKSDYASWARFAAARAALGRATGLRSRP